jgi:DNA-binding response OmpR family regulator
VASTLLAVDDSVTMRKVLEITFASPDFRIVTANSPDAALQKLKADKPDLVIADGTLEPKNGYDLCKEIKRLSPSTPVLYLSSKQNPFDAGKGAGAQVDDHMDKPFDTQQMIDKVKRLLSGQPAAAKPAATAAQTAPSMTAPTAAATAPSAPIKAAQPLPAAAAAAAAQATPLQRAKTLIYNPPSAVGAPAAAAPVAARPAVAAPAPQPAAAQPRPMAATTPSLVEEPTTKMAPPAREHAPSPVAASAAAHVNGQMAGKLEGLGLTPAQAEAVLALSREVVERVVWEVVPVLAETIIKEEISRLTR